ncbi:MAG: polyribonucleotide nucleotidyltransferase [Bacteroidales bacterium]|jgi:polyribonucleotide nucleotidyltransferase|nr:polyribonucleotide nucleotidyltransferase [Bacteroidales bacterium]
MLKIVNKTIDLGDGRTIEIETGKLAKQADGSVVVKMGKTMLLATVCSAQDARPDVDFMPLSVEYKEKFSAMGRFPGGFLKREGRPSDSEILVSRLVDRALRPLFPKDFHAETFVTIQLISAESEVLPDCLAGLAASAALSVSDIPFDGPISEVRVGRVNGQLVVNPSFSQLAEADIDIMVGATYDNVLMIEGEMKEISEEEMLETIAFAHEAIKKQCEVQIELAKEVGKEVKREYCHEENDEKLEKSIRDFAFDKMYAIASQGINAKEVRSEEFKKIEQDFMATFSEEELAELNKSLFSRYFHDVQKDAVRKSILDSQIRIDGRETTEIRPIWCEVDYLPAAHGSAIFTRGETQSLTSITLGTKLDEKIIDDVMLRSKERFLLHYNFPPFSTGDARPYRGVGRREVGHGNLAYRALKGMLDVGEDNPYTIRVVSDILESNGSSSMATVCAGSLALMDAGIRIKKPVTGIAMGLISDKETGKHAILSDILGEEDHLGDMDFKVCGTRDGITAVQMDIKIDGLSQELMKEALSQAQAGRLHIMDKITETLAEPRPDFKDHAPRIEKLIIDKEYIGAIIGSGGKNIQELQSRTNSVITIEEIDGKGEVEIFGTDKNGIEDAKDYIAGLTAEPEVGKVYNATVKTIVQFGAFLEFMPQRDGLLHVSEIDWKRVENVTDVLKEGDVIEVKLLGIDRGKYKLSRKALLPRPEKQD